MKQPLVFGALIIISTAFTANITTVPKLSLTAMINDRSSKHITLKIMLTNNTADTIKYDSWTCWQESYTVDNNKWNIFEGACYYNSRVTLTIPPYRSINNILVLDKSTSIIKTGDSKFRIGFHYIPHTPELENIPDKIKQQKREDFIVWSNTITPAYFTRSLRW